MPHLVKRIEGFLLKEKSFQNTAIYQKLRGGVPSTSPPPPCTTVGVRIRLYVRGLICLFKECCTDSLLYSSIRNGKPTLSTLSTQKKKSYNVLVGAKKKSCKIYSKKIKFMVNKGVKKIMRAPYHPALPLLHQK